jgi:AcrR family transcriptional regulator
MTRDVGICSWLIHRAHTSCVSGTIYLTNAPVLVKLWMWKRNILSASECEKHFLMVVCCQGEKESMEHSGISTKRADALTNRARLLEVAQAVFAESGLDLEVNDIASRARLGVGTLYRHFGNREDLLRAIVTYTVDDAIVQMRQAIEPYTDDPRAALQALVSAGLRVQHQYQRLFVVIRDPRLTKLFDPAQGEAMREQVLDPAREVLERGIKAGIFRDDLDHDLAAATIIGSFTSVFELIGKRYPLAELEQRLSQLLWAMFTK